jgi:hypothetical protein
MNEVAAAAGFNTITAPHKPAPATTLTLARSKVVIDVYSYSPHEVQQNRKAVPESSIDTD